MKWPFGRYTTVMSYFQEVFFTKAKQCSTIHFAIASNIIMYVRLEWFIICVIPVFIWAVTPNRYYFMRIPILFFFRNKPAAFQDQNFFAGFGKCISHRAAATAGANNDDVVMIVHNNTLCSKEKLVSKKNLSGG